MVHLSRTFRALASILVVLSLGYQANAQAKAGGAKKAAAPSKAAKPSKPKPAPLEEVTVCVRPKDVEEKVPRWGYDITGKVVTAGIEDAVRQAGNRWIYVFDAKAPFNSPSRLPIPHNQLRCPNDPSASAPPPPPPSPPPQEILPSAPGEWFPSANPLRPSEGVLPPSALGSSGTTNLGQQAAVAKFCQDAENFNAGDDAPAILATQFVQKLRQSILAKKVVGQIKADELSVEAAGLLAKQFGEGLGAALEQANVIAPLNVLEAFKPKKKNPGWAPFALLDKQAMKDFGLGRADTVLAVMLSRAAHVQMTNLLAEGVPKATTVEALLAVYKAAYADRPTWMSAITPYFAGK